MARGEELLFAHHGRHKEDNATKNLCWLLNNLPWEVSQVILQTILEPVDSNDVLETVAPSDVTVDAQESTPASAERSADAVLVGVANQGHDYDETDVTAFDPSQPPKQSRTLDITIEVNGGVVVGVEAKKGSAFNQAQLQDHARELSASAFGVVTWGALSEKIESLLGSSLSDINRTAISGEAVNEGSLELLLTEYHQLLEKELVRSWQSIGTVPYTTGENSVRLTEQPGVDKLSDKAIEPHEEPSQVPVALVFQSIYEDSSNGGRLFFSPEEWRQLVSSMEPDHIKAIEKGTLAPIANKYQQVEGQLTVAEIQNSAGDKKYIRYGTRGSDENGPLLHFNKSTANGGNLRDIPMYDEDEFSQMFGPESSITKFFTDPERVFDSFNETTDE